MCFEGLVLGTCKDGSWTAPENCLEQEEPGYCDKGRCVAGCQRPEGKDCSNNRVPGSATCRKGADRICIGDAVFSCVGSEWKESLDCAKAGGRCVAGVCKEGGALTGNWELVGTWKSKPGRCRFGLTGGISVLYISLNHVGDSVSSHVADEPLYLKMDAGQVQGETFRLRKTYTFSPSGLTEAWPACTVRGETVMTGTIDDTARQIRGSLVHRFTAATGECGPYLKLCQHPDRIHALPCQETFTFVGYRR